MAQVSKPEALPAWAALKDHAEQLRKTSIAELLASEGRFAECSLEFDGLCVDFSRQLLTPATLDLFDQLADQVNLGERITNCSVVCRSITPKIGLHYILLCVARQQPMRILAPL